MALKEYLLSTIAITILIEISTVYAWNPDINRYESYDLERGPVFYEAYYPDGNEEHRANYPEKRYFDRGAVLEKTYQVPSQSFSYPDNVVPVEDYQNRAKTFLQDRQNSNFPTETDAFNIKEISNLARRAISRDLENWNTIENYLDRAKYQDTSSGRQLVSEPQYRVQEMVREIRPELPNSFKKERDFVKLYEEVHEQPSRQIQSIDQRGSNVIRRFTTRDLANRDSLESFRAIQYRDQSTQDAIGQRTNVREVEPRSIVAPYPMENIFAPRPQVINYIFSKKPVASTENKAQSVSEAKEVGKESVPRNYGDNLIQEDSKKTEQGKDVKVTSIEVSEVPRHKTRHHHGEWPKRDYSHRNQS